MIGRLVRAEWAKLTSTRIGMWLLVVGCVMAGGFTALFTALAGEVNGTPPVGTREYGLLIASVPAQVTIIALVAGVIGMTQEYRHRTATPTFLGSPHRGRVVTAKVVTYAAAGAVLALAVVLVTVLVATVYGGARGAAPSWDGEVLGVLLRSGAALVVYAVIGVGLGALVRNQVGAIVGALVYLFVVEPLLSSFAATTAIWEVLPGGALAALTATTRATDLLHPWQGGVLLLAYGLLAAVLGTLLAVRRDVT